jgi:RNase P/RNase MRP subunit POP5
MLRSEARAGSRDVKKKLCELYDELFSHEGFADLRLEIRILRRGQKEVIIHCGKQYRYVLDYRGRPAGKDEEGLPE